MLRDAFDPAAIAASYERAGATCLSVLTDRPFFQGAPEYLVAARAACALPVLRKEFIIDEYQVAESRALGADAILLIVAALDDARLGGARSVRAAYGMDVLVEVHDARRARPRAAPRDAADRHQQSQPAHVSTCRCTRRSSCCRAFRPIAIVVTESGILAQRDVAQMRRHGVNAFLVGEAFMRAPDPGAALTALFGP